MSTKEKKSRILGLAFLFQFVTSFTSMAIILPMATGIQGLSAIENIGHTMSRVAANSALVYVNIFGELLTAFGVIFLGAVLFTTVRKTHEGLALTAFALYVVEGVLLAAGRLVLFVLLILSQQYAASGAPAALESTGRLVYDAMSYTSTVTNFFFCLGGTVFYALLFKTGTVARPLALWGLISVQGVFAGILMGLFGVKAPIYVYVLYIPFELVIAVWILIRGVKKEAVN